jgi:hypothetical protein
LTWQLSTLARPAKQAMQGTERLSWRSHNFTNTLGWRWKTALRHRRHKNRISEFSKVSAEPPSNPEGWPISPEIMEGVYWGLLAAAIAVEIFYVIIA